MKRFYCVLIASLWCVLCHAEAWTDELTVQYVFTEGVSDIVVVSTNGGGAYAAGCVVNAWMFLADSETRRSRAYATLLAAAVSGQKVKFWYKDSCATWGYHGASAVMLVKG
jgi:hypothetical protein